MRDYRKLEPWQEAREVTTAAFLVARSHWKPEAAPLFEHLQKAVLSVQSNIVLGCTLAPRKYAYHLTMAWGSSMEAADLWETGLKEGILPGDFAVDAIRRCKRCQELLLELIKRHMTS
jgi:four helix bundle protein